MSRGPPTANDATTSTVAVEGPGVVEVEDAVGDHLAPDAEPAQVGESGDDRVRDRADAELQRGAGRRPGRHVRTDALDVRRHRGLHRGRTLGAALRRAGRASRSSTAELGVPERERHVGVGLGDDETAGCAAHLHGGREDVDLGAEGERADAVGGDTVTRTTSGTKRRADERRDVREPRRQVGEVGAARASPGPTKGVTCRDAGTGRDAAGCVEHEELELGDGLVEQAQQGPGHRGVAAGDDPQGSVEVDERLVAGQRETEVVVEVGSRAPRTPADANRRPVSGDRGAAAAGGAWAPWPTGRAAG